MVTHLPDVFYLTGFSGSAAVLLVGSSTALLLTDSRYTFQAREEAAGVRVQIAKKGLIRAAGEAIRRLSARRRASIAYSPSQLTVAQKASIESHSGAKVRWVPADQLVARLRAVKDLDEVATIRAAAQLISRAFEQVLNLIRPGVRETDLAAEIEYRMKRSGASGPSFETIVASGPRSAWAHARPTAKLLKKNELVVLDQGAILRHYCSDMTRTVFTGRAPSRVRHLYSAVLEAQAAAKAAIRPGVEAATVDRAARRALEKRGLDRYFTHSTGHGLGIEVHEIPRLGRGERTPLEAGMVLTVEPGVYVEGFGGIRIEDDVVVTPDGFQELTTARRDFLEL